MHRSFVSLVHIGKNKKKKEKKKKQKKNRERGREREREGERDERRLVDSACIIQQQQQTFAKKL